MPSLPHARAHRPATARRPRSARGGFTLVELVFVVAILALAFQMTLGALANTAKAEPAQRETSRALDAVRDALEAIAGEDPADVFALYNADPADDPGGAGTGPGAGFAVLGLDPVPGDPDGLVGRVEFPVVAGALREDVDDRDLGLPRDLDLDGIVDAADHAGDYRVLPFRVHAEWRGQDQRDHSLTLQGNAIVE